MLTGEAVLAERTRRKLSRTKFSELVGLTPTKIANIERGREIRPDELAALAPHVPVLTADPASTDHIHHSSVDNGDGSGQHSRYATAGSAVILLDEEEEVWFIDLASSDESVTVPTNRLAPATGVTVSPVTTAPVSSFVPGGVPGPPADSPGTTTPELIGVEALYVNGRRRISNSELQTFKHCRRRWWLGWYRGLRLANEPATGPLPLGTRVHLALAAYYVPHGHPGQDPRQALEDVLARDELVVLQSLNDHSAETAAQVMADFKREADLARAMIEGYVEWLAETGADQGYRVIAAEQSLTLPLEMPDCGKDVLLAGKLDVRMRREHDGLVLFMDHKTTQSFERLTKQLLWDEQLRQYHVLEEGNRGPDDPPVTGVLYNMLRKVKRTAQAQEPFYQRVEVHHGVRDLTNFKTRLRGESRTIMDVEDELRAGRDHLEVCYPSPSDRCLWGCEFSAVCPMFDDGSRAEDFITDHYVTTNPLARYDDETRLEQL